MRLIYVKCASHCVGVLCLSLFRYALLYVHQHEEEEKIGCFAVIVLQMSC